MFIYASLIYSENAILFQKNQEQALLAFPWKHSLIYIKFAVLGFCLCITRMHHFRRFEISDKTVFTIELPFPRRLIGLDKAKFVLQIMILEGFEQNLVIRYIANPCFKNSDKKCFLKH